MQEPTTTTPPLKPSALKSSSTMAVHAGEKRYRSHNSLTVPITQTTVYTFDKTADLVNYYEERLFWDEIEREEYGRYGNPTMRAVEAKLAALEGGEDAVLVGSGMSAITSALLLLLEQGGHLILTGESYHGTLDFCQRFLPRYGIEHTVVACSDYDALEAAIRPNTKLIFSESPTNPFMSCVDLARLAEIAKRHQIITAIDTTLATPMNVQPLTYGIDLVIHSVTKYLSGHNDVMAGAMIGNYRLINRLRQAQALFGSIVDPHAAYLILRGLKTLALRVERQNATGAAVARYLDAHPKVDRVWYPALESHRDHKIAMETMSGFGSVVSFELDSNLEGCYQFIDALKIPVIGPSLGGVESVISPLAVMGYADLPEEERLELGITDGLIRYCIGIEETDDLLADIAQALDAV